MMKNILLKIKQLIKKLLKKDIQPSIPKTNNKKQVDLFPGVSIGSIIKAKRDQSKTAANKIKEGHDKGPFIVIAKYDNRLVCSYGTSVNDNEQCNYKIEKIYYNLTKDTYFNTHHLELIKKDRFLEVIDHLDEYDLDKLLKTIKINKGDYYLVKNTVMGVKIKNFELGIGDVYFTGFQYLLVFDIVDNKLKCLEFKGSYKSLDNLDYSKVYTNKKASNLQILKSYDKKYIDLVKSKLNIYKNHKKIQTPLKRGSIVTKNNFYYYIYGEEGQDFLLYQLFMEKQPFYDIIKIDNDIFYTDYSNNKRIAKKDTSYRLFKQLNEVQMNEIKHNKKSYSKVNRVTSNEYRPSSCQKHKYGNNILNGSVIKSDNGKLYYIYNVYSPYI